MTKLDIINDFGLRILCKKKKQQYCLIEEKNVKGHHFYN